MRWRLLVCLVPGLVVGAIAPAAAAPPACKLLPDGLGAIFGITTLRVVDEPTACGYVSVEDDSYALSLMLTTFRLGRNARDYLQVLCTPPADLPRMTAHLPGVGRACGFEAVVDRPQGGGVLTGNVAFRRGRTVAWLEAASLASPYKTRFEDVAQMAKGVARRWH